MDNIGCANCGHEISRRASACPNCGHPNKGHDYVPGWAVLLTLVLALSFFWWLAGSDEPESPPRVTKADKPANESKAVIPATAKPQDARELAATMLNLNGLLCAEVVDIRPLQVRDDVHEITCITYRGGSAQKSYHLNINTGKAWPS